MIDAETAITYSDRRSMRVPRPVAISPTRQRQERARTRSCLEPSNPSAAHQAFAVSSPREISQTPRLRRHSRTLAQAALLLPGARRAGTEAWQDSLVDDWSESRELAVVEAWFKRRGLRLNFERVDDEWWVMVTDENDEPVLAPGRGVSRLEAAEDAQGFLE